MLYSVQNSFGEVYGIWPMSDETPLSPNQWQTALSEELGETTYIEEVRLTPLHTAEGERDRVVIDITPSFRAEDATVQRIHEAVGRISTLALGE